MSFIFHDDLYIRHSVVFSNVTLYNILRIITIMSNTKFH